MLYIQQFMKVWTTLPVEGKTRKDRNREQKIISSFWRNKK